MRDPVDHEDAQGLLQLMNNLKLQGFGESLAVPQMVVCGDQSSGKSSVLEALSEVPFEIKDKQCTRFPTELMLRPGHQQHIEISIQPDGDRTPEDKRRLGDFQRVMENVNGLPEICKQVQQELGAGEKDARFVKDILRIRKTGPELPALTLVDLPGLFEGDGTASSQKDVDQVRNMVKDFVGRKRTIILAVIDASQELENQKVTAVAREADPDGVRTLGIVTKPDTVSESPSRVEDMMALVDNQWRDKEQKFWSLELGWSVLRNRSWSTKDSSKAERDDREQQTLSEEPWCRIPAECKGVGPMIQRLRRIMYRANFEAVPEMSKELERSLMAEEGALARLGSGGRDDGEFRTEFSNSAAVFKTNFDRASRGLITLSGFRLQHSLSVEIDRFHDMLTGSSQGQGARSYATDGPSAMQPAWDNYEGFARSVEADVKQEDGIAGQLSEPMIWAKFYEQSAPWAGLVDHFISQLLRVVREGVSATTRQAEAAFDTPPALMKLLLEPTIDTIEDQFRAWGRKEVEYFRQQKFDKPTLDAGIITGRRRLLRNCLDSADVEHLLVDHLSTPRKQLFFDAVIRDYSPARTVSFEVVECVITHYKVDYSLCVLAEEWILTVA